MFSREVHYVVTIHVTRPTLWLALMLAPGYPLQMSKSPHYGGPSDVRAALLGLRCWAAAQILMRVQRVAVPT